jgi:zinc protease
MRRGLTSAIVVALVLAVAAHALGATVRKHRLGNGTTILTSPNEWNRIVAVTAVVDAGSRRDPPTLRGLANLTNSMLLQGTTTRTAPELAELVDSAGLTIGVDISLDNASVYVTAIDSELDLALDVLADVLEHPAFGEKRLLDAQREVYDELEARQDDEFAVAIDRVSQMLYGDRPQAFDPRGTREGISRITPSRLIKFHSRYYVGGGTVISVVGNFDEDHVVERLHDLLADYPGGRAPEVNPPEVSFEGRPPVKVFRDIDEAHIAVGFMAPPASDPDFVAFEVTDAMIGLGVGSRLTRALGEDGANVSDDNGAFCRCGQDVSTFIIYASSQDPDTVLDVIGDEIHSLMTEPVSDQELTTVKNRVVGRHEINGQTNLVRAARLASYELAGLGFDFGDTFLTAVNRVDKDDILRVASEWLDKPATVVVLPGKRAPSGRTEAGI